MSDPAPIFAAEGPLAAAIPGFRARPQQIEMAQKIAEALAGSEMVIEGALLPCVTPWGEKATSPRWHRKH